MENETKKELEDLLKEVIQDLNNLALASEKELITSSLRSKYSRKLKEFNEKAKSEEEILDWFWGRRWRIEC